MELNMTTTGKEKSNEEVIYNNLINYMEREKFTLEEQREYLKTSIIHMEYENSKRKLANKIGTIPSIVLLLGATGSYFTLSNSMTLSLLMASGTFALIGKGIKVVKNNPYNKDMAYFGEIKHEEEVYRKVARHVK